MSVGLPGGAHRHYLTELVEREARKSLPRAPARAWGISAVGLFLAPAGAYSGFILPAHLTSTGSVEGVVLITVGVAVALSQRDLSVCAVANGDLAGCYRPVLRPWPTRETLLDRAPLG